MYDLHDTSNIFGDENILYHQSIISFQNSNFEYRKLKVQSSK